jgi:hypothetical protein
MGNGYSGDMGDTLATKGFSALSITEKEQLHAIDRHVRKG